MLNFYVTANIQGKSNLAKARSQYREIINNTITEMSVFEWKKNTLNLQIPKFVTFLKVVYRFW